MWGQTDVSFHDPMQGGLGDCWIIAASSVVAQDPIRIKNIFEVDSLNYAGVYAVTLHLMGVPVTITIDDYLPFINKGRDFLLYARNGPDGALWMPILEKAAAKLYGNYEVMVGGHMGPAISTLTGAPYFRVTNADMGTDELWEFIDKSMKDKFMITCQSF